MSAPSSPRPPRLSRALLSRTLHPADRPFALADLDEEYEERVADEGVMRARWWYRRQVITSLAPALRGRFVRRSARGHAGAAAAGSSAGYLTALGADLRLGGRALLRAPMVSLLTVLSLGVGLGGVTTVLAIVNGLVFEPPVGLAEPEQIVSIYRTDPDGHPYGGVAWADFLDLRTEVGALGDVAASESRTASLAGSFAPVSVFAEVTSANYFEVTGMSPVLGRSYAERDLVDGVDTRVAVLGHALWRSRFDGRPDVIGSTIRLDGVPFTVIGVAPDGVRSRRVPLETDVWIPAGSRQPSGTLPTELLTDRSRRSLMLIGRRSAGATMETVQAQVDVLAGRLAAEHPEWTGPADRAQALTVVSEARSRTNPRARGVLLAAGAFFLTVAALILVLACANVAGLFVARAHRRRTEMAVRASLGASRARIVRMLLAEGIWPGVLGGLLGIGIAGWATYALDRVALPVEVPMRLSVDLSPAVLLVTLGVTVLATLASSLLPLVGRGRVELVGALRASHGGPRARFLSLRNGLVIVQCFASAVLGIGAMLFARSLSVATTSDLGYEHEGIAVATHRLPESMSDAETVQAARDLRDRLASRDGVDHVALSTALELTFFLTLTPLRVDVDGYEPPAGTSERVFHNAVTPGYLELLEVPMVAGRTIEESDGPGAPAVAVINQSFAERYWPGLDPIGRTFALERSVAAARSGGGIGGPVGAQPAGGEGAPSGDGSDRTMRFEVVGVARDGAYLDFDDGPMPYFWSSLYQDVQPHVAVAVKGPGPAHDHLPLLRREVVPEDGVVQLMAPSVLADQVSVQFLHLRVLSSLLGWGGLFGIFLAVIGIYGIVAFAVTQRSREMAIRIALGAEKRGVVRSVAMEGIRLAAVGLLAGALAAVPLARLIRGVLHGVSPADPRALLYALGPLLLVAIIASVIPARRITGIDPMVTLRSE